MPIRIYDLAKEVKRSNAEVVAMLEKEGFGTLSPSSNIDDVTAEKIRNNINDIPKHEENDKKIINLYFF